CPGGECEDFAGDGRDVDVRVHPWRTQADAAHSFSLVCVEVQARVLKDDASAFQVPGNKDVEGAAEEVRCVIVRDVIVAGAVDDGPSGERELDLAAVSEHLADVI